MLKIALVGVGGISAMHIPAWEAIEGVELTALCSLRMEQMERYPDKHRYTDFEEMLEKEKPDILDICVPTFLHVKYALMALQRGIHVLCEKPLTLKVEDVKQIYQVAQENHAFFMVAHVLRFFDEYQILKELYDTKYYGQLLSGTMTRVCESPKWSEGNWLLAGETSGLALYDTHIHDLDFMVYTFGAPKSAEAVRTKKIGQDHISVIYHFDTFSVAAESAWYDAPYPFKAEFRFQFENAVVEYADRSLVAYEKGGNIRVLTTPKESISCINLSDSEPYANEIRYFADCIKRNVVPEKVKQEEIEAVLNLLNTIK